MSRSATITAALGIFAGAMFVIAVRPEPEVEVREVIVQPEFDASSFANPDDARAATGWYASTTFRCTSSKSDHVLLEFDDDDDEADLEFWHDEDYRGNVYLSTEDQDRLLAILATRHIHRLYAGQQAQQSGGAS